ncbi:hypothetical protein DL96DRAFT_1571791 [Flagelloscypha sp. PMI_526]|nr:hypothetical protein DL96DRAFT_1571791 [Flagelloscypha sp. PMI_526]
MPAYTTQNTGLGGFEDNGYTEQDYEQYSIRSPVSMMHNLSLSSPSWRTQTSSSGRSQTTTPTIHALDSMASSTYYSRPQQDASLRPSRNHSSAARRDDSSGPTTPDPSEAFVYPGGRSRARPSKAPSPSPASWSKLKSKFGKKSKKTPTNDQQSSVSSMDSSGKSKTSAKKDPNFVYPSSRTRANPKSSSAAVLAVKKSKGKEGEYPSHIGGQLVSAPPQQTQFVSTSNYPRPNYAPASTQWNSSDTDLRHPRTATSLPDPPTSRFPTSPTNSSASSRPAPAKRNQSKLDTYPLNPYDTTLLKLDELTHGLLRQLTIANSPSFHAYGNFAPTAVLDVGCGEGHWLLDAAVAWANHGTRITGIDAVDVTKSMWPRAASLRVKDSIQVLRSNFVRDSLPFPDGSFDFVRMANLSLAIPTSQWDSVLREVCRVCAVGGRIEIVEESVIFPHGDTEGSEQDDQTARDLETLWSDMLKKNYHVDLNPSAFIQRLMEYIFGNARQVTSMQLTATTSPQAPVDRLGKDPPQEVSGLMVLPWRRFIPMSKEETMKGLVDYVASLNRSFDDADSVIVDHQDEDSEVTLNDRCQLTSPSDSLSPLASSRPGLRSAPSSASMRSTQTGPPSYARAQREAQLDPPDLSPIVQGKHIKTITVWEATKMSGFG